MARNWKATVAVVAEADNLLTGKVDVYVSLHQDERWADPVLRSWQGQVGHPDQFHHVRRVVLVPASTKAQARKAAGF